MYGQWRRERKREKKRGSAPVRGHRYSPAVQLHRGLCPHPEYEVQWDPKTIARVPKDPPSRREIPKADPAALPRNAVPHAPPRTFEEGKG